MNVQRFYLTYSEDKIKEPVIYWVGHKFRVVTNIRGASISDKIGIVALELEGDEEEIRKAAQWIAGQGVKVEPIEKNVIE
jgi:ABC-type methionine transport system ATPase subunit